MLEALPEEARSVIRHRLVRLDAQEGKADLVREHLARGCPNQIARPCLAGTTCGNGSRNADLAEVEQWESKLRKIEGEDGVFWQYYRAYRLLAEATGPEDGELVEALHSASLDRVAVPQLGEGPHAQRAPAHARGDVDRAVMAYREAVALGERSPSVVRLLISRLLETNRSEEAEHVLCRCSAARRCWPPITTCCVAPSRRSACGSIVPWSRAPDRRAIARRSLVQVLAGAIIVDRQGEDGPGRGRVQESGRAGPRRAAAGGRTVQFLLAFEPVRRRPRSAAKSRKEKEARRRTMCVTAGARGYRLLGDKEQALGKYREAARLDPKNAALQVQLAEYLGERGYDRQRC